MAWTRADTITIDHTKVPSTDQSNFPVLVLGQYANLATVANGGVVTSASGYDIIFAADAAGVTTYAFERVSWDATTGKCEFWVKVPTVSHTTNTTFYCLNGNSAITTDQQNATGTWDANFIGVYHMNVAGTDSTTINPGTNHSTTVVTSPAQVGSSGAFSGSSQYIDLGTGVNLGGAGATLEFWGRFTSLTGSSGIVGLVVKGQWAGDANGDIRLIINGTQHVSFQVGNSGSVGSAVNDPNTAPTGSFHHWVGVWAGGTNGAFTLYKDGVSVATANITGTVTNNGHSTFLGAYPNQIAGTSLTGYEDEVRISNIGRSADWITTCYNNQFSPATFYSTTLIQPLNVSKLVTYFLVKPFNTNPPVWPIFAFPDGYVGIAYSQAWDMPDASQTVTYTVISGSLPPGLGIVALTGNQANISGIPLTEGIYPFTLRASNTYGVADEAFSITIHPLPANLGRGGSFMFIN